MPRPRFQSSKPIRRGRWWTLLYWSDELKGGKWIRKRRRVKLAPSETPEAEILKIAERTLKPINQRMRIDAGSTTTLRHFLEAVYVPTVLCRMSKSTRERYNSVIKNHLEPNFGGIRLQFLNRLTLERNLSGPGSSLDYESKDEIREVLFSIFSLAVQHRQLVANPIERLRLLHPKQR
jgi:Phage integrase, N-terminal SAM-like domain